MKVLFLFIILLLLTGQFVNGQIKQNSLDSSEYYLKKAKILYEEKNYIESIKYAEFVIKKDLLNKEAHFAKAQAQLSNNQYEEARKSFQFIVDEKIGNRKSALTGKGISESNLLSYQASINTFIEVLKIDSINRVANYYIGYNNYYLGNYANSILHLKKAYRVKPGNIETLRYLGEAYLMINIPDSALNYFNKLQQLNNDLIEAHLGKAKSFLLMGDFVKAENEVIIANRIKITPEGYLLLANIYENLGKNELWYEALVQLKNIDPKFEEAILSEIRLLLKVKDFESIIKMIGVTNANSPLTKNYLLFYKGKSFQGLQKIDSAIVCFEKIDSAYWQILKIDFELGMCYEFLNLNYEALNHYRSYSENFPNDLNGIYYKSKLCLKLYNPEEAKKGLLILLNQKESPEIYDNLASASLMAKNYKDALQYSEVGLKLSSKSIEEEYLLTTDKTISLMMLKDYKSAINTIDNYKTQDYKAIMSLKVLKCVSLFGQGQFKKMDKLVNSFSKEEIYSSDFLIKTKLFCLLNDNKPEEYIKLAYEYCDNGNNSLSVYNFSNEIDKKFLTNYEIIENKYVLCKNIDTTINFTFGFINDTSILNKTFTPILNQLSKSIKAYSKSEIIYLLIAQLKHGLMQKDALKYFNEAIEENPNYKLAYYLRGMYYKNVIKDNISADQDFKNAE